MATVQDRPRAGQQTTRTAPVGSTALVPAVFSRFVERFNLDRTQIDLIKQTCCPKGTTDNQMALFFHECARRGVHPMDRLLIMVLFRDDSDDDSGDTKNAEGKKPVFITTIDLHRAQAESTGTYAGTNKPVYGPPIKQEVTEWEGKGRERKVKRKYVIDVPEWAEVTTFKMVGGQRVPYVGVANWKEFYPGNARGSMWHKMPKNQLAKCAEAQALRKANPRKLARLYIHEEMEQAFGAEDAKPAGRGRTKAAEASQPVDTPMNPSPDPVGVHDITDAAAHETPPADRWLVVGIDSGHKRGKPNEPIWKLTAENGEHQQQAFYTDQQPIAEKLKEFQARGTVFALSAEAHGNTKQLVEIAPVV